MAKSGLKAVATGGILFYKVPTRVLFSFRAATAQEMADREEAILVARLIGSAERYVRAGRPLLKLTPWRALRLGPFPRKLAAQREHGPRQLLMVFTREGLAHAAQRASEQNTRR
jgi:hypothetical protein